MIMQPGQPIMVHVVQQPTESTTISDVLIGSIGLTGVLLLAAVILGGLLGAVLIGLHKLRARLYPDAPLDSETIRIF